MERNRTFASAIVKGAVAKWCVCGSLVPTCIYPRESAKRVDKNGLPLSLTGCCRTQDLGIGALLSPISMGLHTHIYVYIYIYIYTYVECDIPRMSFSVIKVSK